MTTAVSRTRPAARLSLKDRLSRLTFLEACKFLGPQGKDLIQRNANTWEFKIAEDVYFSGDLFRLRFPGEFNDGRPLTVTITLLAEARNRLHWRCNRCEGACEHAGAAFSLILEDKLKLGLAEPPKPRTPVESLPEEDLVACALGERAERAKTEKMTVESADPSRPWTDYTVRNRASGKTYRVALRGATAGESYCSCPDFRTNTLGTCKHVMRALTVVRRRFDSRALSKPFVPSQIGVFLKYVGDVTLWVNAPKRLPEDVRKVIEPLLGRPIDDLHDLLKRIGRLPQLGHEAIVYPDAEEFIQQRLFQERMRERTAAIRRDPYNHPLRKTLLKTPLLPYQLDGIAFASGIGRAVLADDMGLGKTIQGVGVAEYLAREAELRKVLVVCPASLKSKCRS